MSLLPLACGDGVGAWPGGALQFLYWCLNPRASVCGDLFPAAKKRADHIFLPTLYPTTKGGGCTSFARKGASAHQEQSCVHCDWLISRMCAANFPRFNFLKGYGVPIKCESKIKARPACKRKIAAPVVVLLVASKIF